MPRFVHTDVLDNGLNVIKNSGNRMVLITSYAQGESYATVNAKAVASVAMVAADFTLGALGTYERQITVAAKSVNATVDSPATPDLHVAILDTAGSRVLAVANESSDQSVKAGNPVDFPAWTIRARQPV